MPGAGEERGDQGRRIGRALIEQPGDVGAQRAIVRDAIEPGEPFAAGQHAIGAILVDQAADEGAERAVRGRLGDQAEDGAAGIISALLVASSALATPWPVLSRMQSSIAFCSSDAPVISRIDLGDDAEGEQVGAALGDPLVARILVGDRLAEPEMGGFVGDEPQGMIAQAGIFAEHALALERHLEQIGKRRCRSC